MLLALLFSCLAKPAGLSELTPEHDALVLAWAQALDAGDLAQLAPTCIRSRPSSSPEALIDPKPWLTCCPERRRVGLWL